MEIKDAYRQKLSAQLKEWSAQINLFEAKLENLSADMRIQRAEELHALRDKQRTASEQLKELGRASADAWETVKETSDKIWDDLKSGVAEAQAKFK